MVKEIQGRKTSLRVSVLGWDIMTTLCVPWSQSSQASQRLGAAGSSCTHCWQLKDNSTWKRERPSGQKDDEGSFFPSPFHSPCIMAEHTDNLVTEDLYTCPRQPGFCPYLCDLGGEVRFQTYRRVQFSWASLSLSFPLSSCSGQASQLQNSLRCEHHPQRSWAQTDARTSAEEQAATESIQTQQVPGNLWPTQRENHWPPLCAARQTSHEEEWKHAQHHLRRIRKLPAHAVQWYTHIQSGHLSHRRLIGLLFNGCTVEKKKRLSSHVACCNWLLQQLTVRPWQLSD